MTTPKQLPHDEKDFVDRVLHARERQDQTAKQVAPEPQPEPKHA